MKEQIVYRQLKNLGVPAHLKGHAYLHEAVLMALEDPTVLSMMTKQLYPEIAKKYNTTATRVERNIRHAVEYVFMNTDESVLFECFGNTTSRSTGKVTNSQFIASVAAYINMEVSK